MFCHCDPELPRHPFSPQPSPNNNFKTNDDEDAEEINRDPPPKEAPAPTKPEPCNPQDTSRPKVPNTTGTKIPLGAKQLKLDFSEISERALPYKICFKKILGVDHASVFSRHD